MQLHRVFIDWLHKRKISDTVIEQFKLRMEGDRLAIPIYTSDGEFSFNKYRRNPLSDAGPKYTYDKGGKLALFGQSEAEKYFPSDEPLLWTEGEMDALVAWSHNIPAVSGTGGALSMSEEWKTFFHDKQVIICFDNDDAGGQGAAKALDLVPHALILFLPDKPGVKDISDYVAHGGNLTELVRTAKRFTSLEDIVRDRTDRLSVWQSTYFHDAYIKNHTKPIAAPRSKVARTSGDDVTRAKQYPIPELLRFNASGSISCLWHAETEASLHYYPEQNRLWCFGGCGRGYDAIDVYRKIHNCSFSDAIKALK